MACLCVSVLEATAVENEFATSFAPVVRAPLVNACSQPALSAQWLPCSLRSPSFSFTLSLSPPLSLPCSQHTNAIRVGKGHDESKDHEGIVLPRHSHVGCIHGHEWSQANQFAPRSTPLSFVLGSSEVRTGAMMTRG